MRRIFKGLVIALIAFILATGGVFAYTAVTVTSDVQVMEPISISSVAGEGSFDFNNMIWDIGQIYPLDNPSLAMTFSNAAAGDITLTLSIDPSSLDGGNLTFSFDSATLLVPAGGTATVTLFASTTQSLSPGFYSTAVTVDR
jgi:hypothetical protein